MTARDLNLEEIGNDVSTFVDGDLDLSFAPIAGSRVVAEGVLRNWITKRKACFWAPHLGRNINSMVNGDLTRADIERVKIGLVQEAKGVDGCLSCAVTIRRVEGTDEDEGAWEVLGNVRTKVGTSDVNVSIGNAGQIIGAQIRDRVSRGS